MFNPVLVFPAGGKLNRAQKYKALRNVYYTRHVVFFNWLLEKRVELNLGHLVPLTLWASDMNCDFICKLSRLQILSFLTNGEYILILSNLWVTSKYSSELIISTLGTTKMQSTLVILNKNRLHSHPLPLETVVKIRLIALKWPCQIRICVIGRKKINPITVD